MTNEWFKFTLGFADDGPDGDTVHYMLGRLIGGTVRVTGVDVLVDPFDTITVNVIVGGFEQDDVDPDYPMFLVGWIYDQSGDEYRGARVRMPLRGAHITVY